MHRRDAGFTLIELLVVIAIIAILAAILFPVFARAREKARQSACASNLKQLQLAVNMYAQDYDEMLPREGYDVPSVDHGDSDASWRAVTYPYVKNAQLYVCPSHRPSSPVFDGSVYADKLQHASYAINDCHQDSGAPTPPKGVALGQVEDASSVVFLLESTNADDDLCPAANTHGWVPSADWATRHNGGANYAFMDGHVKWLKPNALCPTSGDCLMSIQME